MSLSLRIIKASFTKEMRVWKRNPQKIGLILLFPILFFSAFTLLMGGVYYGRGLEVALVVEEQNPGVYTDGLIEILGEYDPIPPRLVPIQMDAETAEQLFETGDILLVITIPSGFENAVAANESTSIHIQVANIHEDLTKNLRMPVIRKLDIFYQRFLPDEAPVTFEVETLRSYTPPRLAYMGWTITLYGIMVGAIYAAGSAMTQEFEQDTMIELNLSNESAHSIYFGKMMSGVVVSYIATPLLFLLGFLLFNAWPSGNIFTFLLLTLLLSIFCSGIGIILGTVVRNSVFLVPLAALGGIFYWIVSGGIAPLELVGVSFGAVNEYLPVSNVYRSVIRMFVENSYGTLFVDLTVIGIFAVVLVVISPFVADRLSEVDFGQRLEELKKRRSRQEQ
ncbi:MAG: ABC transporter permease [Candidatus Thorarchaeota archaeon]